MNIKNIWNHHLVYRHINEPLEVQVMNKWKKVMFFVAVSDSQMPWNTPWKPDTFQTIFKIPPKPDNHLGPLKCYGGQFWPQKSLTKRDFFAHQTPRQICKILHQTHQVKRWRQLKILGKSLEVSSIFIFFWFCRCGQWKLHSPSLTWNLKKNGVQKESPILGPRVPFSGEPC